MITNHPIGILDREQNFCAGGSRRHRMADLPGNSDGDPGHGGDQACHEKQGLLFLIKIQSGKLQLIPFSKMAEHQHPIFTDKSVHMMMAVLSFFRYDDQDESVRRVHEVSFMLFFVLGNCEGVRLL